MGVPGRHIAGQVHDCEFPAGPSAWARAGACASQRGIYSLRELGATADVFADVFFPSTSQAIHFIAGPIRLRLTSATVPHRDPTRKTSQWAAVLEHRLFAWPRSSHGRGCRVGDLSAVGRGWAICKSFPCDSACYLHTALGLWLPVLGVGGLPWVWASTGCSSLGSSWAGGGARGQLSASTGWFSSLLRFRGVHGQLWGFIGRCSVAF